MKLPIFYLHRIIGYEQGCKIATINVVLGIDLADWQKLDDRAG
jgi:hypothetical protein